MLRKVHMFDFNVQNGDKNLKFIDPNWSEEILWSGKSKTLYHTPML